MWRLDRRSSLAAGLRFQSVATGAGPLDVVTGRLMAPASSPAPYRVRQNGIAADSNGRAGHWELANWDNPGATPEHTVLAWFRSQTPASTNLVGGNWNGSVGGFSINFGQSFFNAVRITWFTQSQYSSAGLSDNLSGRELAVVGRYSVAANERSIWYDGTKRHALAADGNVRANTGPITLLGDVGSTTDRLDGYCYTMGVWSRALSDAEILLLLRDPFAALTQARRSRVVSYLSSAAAGISGTADQFLGPITSTSVGTVRIGGSQSQTLNRATQTAAGGVRIGGSQSQQLGRFTVSASGGVRIAGSAAATLDGFTMTSAGVVGSPPITGSASAILANIAGSAAGTVPISGSSSVTLNAAIAAAAAGLRIGGSGAIVLSPALGSATGATGGVVITGTASARLGLLLQASTATVVDGGLPEPMSGGARTRGRSVTYSARPRSEPTRRGRY
jgi:hypothetical protein